jgi:glycosyltransferase involved in cell wall biosynthesis
VAAVNEGARAEILQRPLRILHLFANFKWTGPADPAIRTAHHLREAGADVMFAQAKWIIPGAEHWIRPQLARWRLPVTADLELRKHFRIASVLADARTLRARLARGDFDVLHCHLLGDHLIAALARRGVPRRITVVRSLYDPEPPPLGWRQRIALRGTDGIVAPTRRCTELAAARYRWPAARVLYQEPTTEPRPPAGDAAGRRALGLAPEHLAVGITARIQPHRRFDLLWETARRVADAEPRTRFVLLGRGNERDTRELVTEPLRRLGLAAHVVLPGYLAEPAYTRALRALDVFVFLVPGSDGTCRAVREAMATGLPVVATRRGMLPDLLDGDPHTGAPACGLTCPEDAAELAAALLVFLRDPSLRARVGAAGRARATTAMDPRAAAARMLAFYAELRARP